MALTTGETKYIELYQEMSKAMVATDSIFDVVTKKLVAEFENFGLDNEKKSELLSQAYQQTMISYNQDALTSVVSIAQEGLVKRQIQGYDDNMLIKVMEQQGGVTSFAVNSDSDSAQSTIFDLKDIQYRVQERVEKILIDEPDGIAPRASVLPPINLRSLTVTSTSIETAWDASTDAISYEVYADGVLVTTTSNLFTTYSGLTADTKYGFNVKAVHTDTVTKSDLSPTVSIRTAV